MSKDVLIFPPLQPLGLGLRHRLPINFPLSISWQHPMKCIFQTVVMGQAQKGLATADRSHDSHPSQQAGQPCHLLAPPIDTIGEIICRTCPGFFGLKLVVIASGYFSELILDHLAVRDLQTLTLTCRYLHNIVTSFIKVISNFCKI